MKTLHLSGFLSILLLIPGCLFGQQAGDLDTTFGAGGMLSSAFGNDGIKAVFHLQDGKILATGSSDQQEFILARYEEDGALDNAYGMDGYIAVPNTGMLTAAALQPGENPYIVLSGYNASGTVVVKYHLDGTADSSFGWNGMVQTDICGQGFSDYAQAVAVQPDHKIVVAGYCRDDTFTVETRLNVIRYLPDGNVDSSFGTDGIISAANFPALGAEVYALQLQNDQKILVSGYNGGSFICIRFNTDGTTDSTFGANGVFSVAIGYIQFGSGGAFCTSSLLQPDGKILLAGWASSSMPAAMAAALIRLNPDGTADPDFGDEGISVYEYPGNKYTRAYSLALQEDGKIVTAGILQHTYTNYHENFYLLRFLDNGAVDTAFGDMGTVVTAVSDSSMIYSVTVQNDGKILAGGYGNNGFSMARYHASSTTDTATAVDDMPLLPHAVSLFPNPAQNKIQLTFAAGIYPQDITITDMYGRNMRFDFSKNAIDISAFGAGVYFVRIITNKGVVLKRFIKD